MALIHGMGGILSLGKICFASWSFTSWNGTVQILPCYRRISNWASPRTSALKPRLSVSSHNTDARQTIERLTLSSYSACVNTENLVIKPGSAQIDVNFVNLKFVYSSCIMYLYSIQKSYNGYNSCSKQFTTKDAPKMLHGINVLPIVNAVVGFPFAQRNACNVSTY